MDYNQTTTPTPSLSPDELKRQRKKQAKREAKAMQVLDQARRELKKAEQKLARAQQNLQAQQEYLLACEAKLENIRIASRTLQSATTSPEAFSEAEIEIEKELTEMPINEAAPAFTEQVDSLETEHLLKPDDNITTAELVEAILEDALETESVPLFDENETVELAELSTEESALEAVFTADLPSIEELVEDERALTAEQPQDTPAIQEEIAASAEEQTESRAQDSVTEATSAVQPVEAEPAPTKTPAARRTRASTSTSTSARSTTRRTPSSRTKANGTDKANDTDNS